jgi:hypothetical protein
MWRGIALRVTGTVPLSRRRLLPIYERRRSCRCQPGSDMSMSSGGDPRLRNPITGIVGCCACIVNGPKTAED